MLLTFLVGTAHASTRHTTVEGNGFTCSRTQPEYMINAGGSKISVQNGSYKFSVTKVDAPGYSGLSDPYISEGFNNYRSASLCNTRTYHGSHFSRAYALPVKLGRQGRVIASAHDIISRNFRGNSGFDIWFTRHPGEHSYDQMVNGGSGTTEVMIWLQRRGFPGPGSFNTRISGHRWGTTVGLAAYGHGRTAHRKGWNVVNFIAPGHSNNVTFGGLKLNSFFNYAISHGWLNPRDYLMSVNQGFEIYQGRAAVTGYVLSGLPH
jgi:hypothetical protein